MKKILAMLLLVLSLSLASCRQGGDVIALVDNPDTTIAADLGLENIKFKNRHYNWKLC